MKNRYQLLILLGGAFFAQTFFLGDVSAQTLLSSQADIKSVELSLDQELDAAMKSDKQPVVSTDVRTSARPVRKPKKPPVPNVFARTFYASPEKKSESITSDVLGFTVFQVPSRKMDAEFAVITNFGGEVVKTRYLKGLKTIDDVFDYVQDNLEIMDESGVEIRQLTLPGAKDPLFWVGDKSFEYVEEAKNMIIQTKQQAEQLGGNFDEMVSVAQAEAVVEDDYVTQFDQSYLSNQRKEEDLLLKWADQLDLGEQLWGPFHGDPAGEPITWQSFGETSWRKTNLESNKFRSQVGFWTNIVVFRGLRFPLNTIDPFLETTISMEAVPEDFKSHVTFFAGAEWRPLARNHFLANYRPFGSIRLLEWARNYRFFVKYGNRKNIKDEISAHDWDLQAGVQLFYEFGVELPDLSQPAPETFTEYLQEFVWGEYFADYHWAQTDFSTDKHSGAWTFGNSLMLGVKLPGIPLPQNPINDELVFMPYLRWNSSYNSTHSFSFQNRYYVSAGVRWMPFRTWRHKENEWLSKVKVFGEWIAIGKTQTFKEDSSENQDFIRNDLRFGVSFASRRY